MNADPVQLIFVAGFGAFIGFVAGLWVGTKWEERRWTRERKTNDD